MLDNGDCSVIQTPLKKNIIIDGGNNQDYDYGKNVVVPYLLDRKITSLDYLMVSHFDSDHCGGLMFIVENLNVKNIIIGKQESEYENCKIFLELAKSKKINIIVVKAGDIVKLDKYTYFEILWPDEKLMLTDSENGINNNSIVAKLIYRNFSCIFTGDIEKKAEEKLVSKYSDSQKLNCNVLKVSHHGSKSSSIEEILNLYNPQVALIGVGKNNKYGHPNKDVISRFEQLNTKVFRTDESGEISIEINNKR